MIEPLPGEPGEAEYIFGPMLAVGLGTRVGVLASHWDQVSRPLAGLTSRLTTFTTDPALARALAESRVEARHICSPDDLPHEANLFDLLFVTQFLEGCPWQFSPGDLVVRGAGWLRPGGVMCLGFPTPWYGVGWYRRVVAWAGALAGSDWALLDAGARAFGSALGGRRIHPPRAYRAALRAAGLRLTGQYAPAPSVHRLDYLVPLDDPRAAAYLFRTLLPRPYAPFAALWNVAAVLARAGLLPLAVPHVYLLAHKPGR